MTTLTSTLPTESPSLPTSARQHMHKLGVVQKHIDLAPPCSSCALHPFCMPAGLEHGNIDKIENISCLRRAVRRGQALYFAGDPFVNIYAVRAGSLKTILLHRDGRKQVTGFQMAGEMLGLDGIGTQRHTCDAIALEDSQVCVIPFQRIERLSQHYPEVLHLLHRLLGQEIAREYRMLMMLGNMRAEERLATFILEFAEHLSSRGYSARVFNLRVTREEIGNYLGLTMETISRVFSHFQNAGLISVQRKQVKILKLDALRAVLMV